MQQILKQLKGDRSIWLIVVMLSLFSALAVYSATGGLAFQNQQGNTEHYLIKQLSLIGLGFGLMYMAHLVNHNYYWRIAQLLLLISLPLLLYTLLFGANINDARRWVNVPVLNITFQTSDLAKLALIMYLARMLSKNQHIIGTEKGFIPVIVPTVVVCILIVPADLSTALLLFITSLILMFIGRVKIRHMMLTLWIGASLLFLYVGIISMMPEKGRVATWQSRIERYVNGNENDQYQITQAKIALANGGLVRVAPGKSVQRHFLPHPYSDFIYAIIIEEYGLLGGVVIVFLYLAFLYRCILIFVRSPGAFGAFLAVGLSISLVIQALMNMAVTVGILPVTGLTLPLVSMGGTSLLFTSVAIGIILSVSSDIEKLNVVSNGNFDKDTPIIS